MTTLLTKGGLTPGTISTIKKSGSTPEIEVKFMFNPSDYTLTKSSTFNETTVEGRNVPLVSFQSGSPMTLNLTLFFDTLDTRTDSGTYTSVRDYTFFLWKMMMIDTSVVHAVTKKSEPPPVEFNWGNVNFKAVITSLTEKLTLFSETGTPLRAEMTVALQQFFDPDATPPQDPTQPTWTTTAPKTSTFTAGLRLDLVAAATAKASMRAIAAANNIDNPLNIPNGTNLLT
jgi:hypothetical protein